MGNRMISKERLLDALVGALFLEGKRQIELRTGAGSDRDFAAVGTMYEHVKELKKSGGVGFHRGNLLVLLNLLDPNPDNLFYALKGDLLARSDLVTRNHDSFPTILIFEDRREFYKEALQSLDEPTSKLIRRLAKIFVKRASA